MGEEADQAQREGLLRDGRGSALALESQNPTIDIQCDPVIVLLGLFTGAMVVQLIVQEMG